MYIVVIHTVKWVPISHGGLENVLILTLLWCLRTILGYFINYIVSDACLFWFPNLSTFSFIVFLVSLFMCQSLLGCSLCIHNMSKEKGCFPSNYLPKIFCINNIFMYVITLICNYSLNISQDKRLGTNCSE